MGMTIAPLALTPTELKKRYKECIRRGIKNPTIWDVDPEFKKWYDESQRFYSFAFPVLYGAAIILIILIIFVVLK